MSSANSIVSKEAVQKLNEKVQKQLDSRLFLCCNYEPTPYFCISEDAKFLIAVQDLYKFAIDTSAVIPKNRHYLRNNSTLKRQLEENLAIINTLRTQFSHNQSEQDGYEARAQLKEYTNWINFAIQKSMPESEKDYTAMNQALCRLSKMLLRQLEEFIDHISNASNKDELIDQWRNDILYWYTHNTKTRYYDSQLTDVFNARAQAQGMNYDKPHMRRQKINRWIEKALYYPIESEIAECERWIKNFSDFREKVGEDKVKKLKDYPVLESKYQENQSKISKLTQERCELEKNIKDGPRNFFFSKLEEYLRDTMNNLDKDGTRYTLLPQDLMQEDIDRRFSKVPVL